MPNAPPSAPSEPAVFRHKDLVNMIDVYNPGLKEEDFYSEGVKPQDVVDEAAMFGKSIEPIVRALETGAFALPAAGVFASAGIGLIWSVCQPGSLKQYQEPAEQMIGRITASKLTEKELQTVRADLDQFYMDWKVLLDFAVPDTIDEISHSEAIAKRLQGYVAPGGLLLTAFYKAKDNLPWFSGSSQGLVVTAAHYIMMSYTMSVSIWQQIAYQYRRANKVAEYNNAQLEVINLTAAIPNTIKHLRALVEEQVALMKENRINKVQVKFDERGVTPMTPKYYNRGEYHESVYVLDGVSLKKLIRVSLQAESVGGKIVDGLRVVIDFLGPPADHRSLLKDGTKDDAAMQEIGDVAAASYKNLLEKHTEEHFKEMFVGLDRVLQISTKFANFTHPGHLSHHPPIPVENAKPIFGSSKSIQAATEGLKVGDNVSYMFSLHATENGKALQKSAWSTWLPVENEGAIKQMYIGDGFAAITTWRRIYQKRSDADQGRLVGTIKGHGILKWPESIEVGII